MTIEDLPPELIISILLYFCPKSNYSDPDYRDWLPEVKSIRQLTHVCQRWRGILHQMPFMWRKIYIHITQGMSIADQDHIFERLEWQMSLTGTLLLDVAWSAYGKINGASIRKMYTLISKCAPFNRWRSLHYDHVEFFPETDEIFIAPNGEGFDQLRFLYMGTTPGPAVIRLLERTALRLNELKVENNIEYANSGPLALGLRSRITTLCMSSAVTNDHVAGFGNVSHFTGDAIPFIMFLGTQNLTHLTCNWATLAELYRVQNLLINLEFLEASYVRYKGGEPLQYVTFPKLRHLVTSWLGTCPDAVVGWIQAPRLGQLELGGFPIASKTGNKQMIKTLGELFLPSRVQSYQLAPSTLILSIPLEPELLSRILINSPSVQHLTITLDLLETPQDETIASMFEQTHSYDWNCCPRLIFLRIHLLWNGTDMKQWIQCARRIVEARGKGTLQGVRVKWADTEEIEILTSGMC